VAVIAACHFDQVGSPEPERRLAAMMVTATECLFSIPDARMVLGKGQRLAATVQPPVSKLRRL
jgi:hypothetical protein